MNADELTKQGLYVVGWCAAFGAAMVSLEAGIVWFQSFMGLFAPKDAL